MIHDISFPAGDSVNDGIPVENSKVEYASVQDAILFIKRAAKKGVSPIWLGKVDIESAYRIIPIHPDDRCKLGFHWRGSFYMDNALPMGAASSCQIFEKLSTALG